MDMPHFDGPFIPSQECFWCFFSLPKGHFWLPIPFMSLEFDSKPLALTTLREISKKVHVLVERFKGLGGSARQLSRSQLSHIRVAPSAW